MLLKNKTAVVYGAGGKIGGAVARAFAREGAKVFLAGRSLPALDAAVLEIAATGGTAEAALVNALDPDAVTKHLDTIVEEAGRIDISFNAIGIRGDLQGTPLLQMPLADFTTPVLTGIQTHCLTATAAARYMVQQNSGVIVTLSSSASRLSGRDRRFHSTGGFAVACAAIETFSHCLAGEIGPQGVRVVCLRPDAIPETWSGVASDAPVKAYMEQGTVLGRLPRLEEVANTAVFLASDWAGAITGATANVTCGSVMN